MSTPGTYAENPAENYERYFVPVIGAPVARTLIEAADLKSGEAVLDVGCGTGVVARMAKEIVGTAGTVLGVDVHPGMLAVARSVSTEAMPIEWCQSPAENVPFDDGRFDAVLSQMSLQFFEDKSAALQEMYRVTAPEGRLILNVPGRISPLFSALADTLGKHIQPELSGFVEKVFSLHDEAELRQLVESVGYKDVSVQTAGITLKLPPPTDFLWQYVHSTPLVMGVRPASNEATAAVEQDIRAAWEDFIAGDGMIYEQSVVTVGARKAA